MPESLHLFAHDDLVDTAADRSWRDAPMTEAATLTLADFLLARIAEDEFVANHWQDVDTSQWAHYHPPSRFNRRWVLAECEAKRQIIELHALTVEKVSQSPFDPDTGERRADEFDVSCAVCGWASSDPDGGCETLRLLALPYASHTDYREEWRP